MRQVKLLAAQVLLLTLAASAQTSPHTISPRTTTAVKSAQVSQVQPLVEEARTAIWLRSDLRASRQAANLVLAKNPAQRDALFVLMETASLEADVRTELDAAIRLCQQSAEGDPRITIAAARLLELASNTEQFRAAIPRLKTLVMTRPPVQANFLRSALLAAAIDGAPGLSALKLSHESGLLTDWKVAGPFGKFSNIDFEHSWEPEQDQLAQPVSGSHETEAVRFEDGSFTLPDYFGHTGVFYASTTVRVGDLQRRTLRFQSPGSAEIFIDGISVLRKDDRLRSHGDVTRVALQMRPGAHKILVKFIPSAMPFQVALLTEQPSPAAAIKSKPPTEEPGSRAEADYVSAALKYWAGNYEGALKELRVIDSVSGKYLLAASWSHLSDDAPESNTALRAGLVKTPDALILSFELAKDAFTARKFDQAMQDLAKLRSQSVGYAPAVEMAAKILATREDTEAAREAIEAAVALHPSCSNLMDAYSWFDTHKEFDRAERIFGKLSGCAPGSLDHAKVLSNLGNHSAAAEEARQIGEQYPFAREIKEFLVRELVLAGNVEQAKGAAAKLGSLAPNSRKYARLAGADPTILLDANAMASLAEQNFYEPYRRDVWTLLKQSAPIPVTSPASVLINDRVIKLNADGSVFMYEHRVVRVRNREGVDQYREATLPVNAEIIELRTLKSDGTVVEPEFTRHKETITMPALTGGDAVEQEYLVRSVRDGVENNADKFQFSFGSFKTAVESSRFVVITPETTTAAIIASGTPTGQTETREGQIVRSWEMKNLKQSQEEAATPQSPLLPTVQVFATPQGGWNEIRDAWRNQFIEASRIGLRVEEAAHMFSPGSDEDRARQLYHYVVATIRGGRPTITASYVSSAERTLARRSGSRTAVMLALARAMNLQADLVMARDVDSVTPPAAYIHAYKRPLVVFHLNGKTKDVLVDAEGDEHAFEALPPGIETEDALLVTMETTGPAGQSMQSPVIALAHDSLQEKTTTEGDVRFDSDGTMSVHMNIRLGATGSAQARAALSNADATKRNEYFEHLAGTLFPGAGEIHGKSKNEGNPDLPLEVTIDCLVEDGIKFGDGVATLDQLASSLNLTKSYAKAETRAFPLFIDSPFFESMTLQVHLPTDVSIPSAVPNVNEASKFGNYAESIKELAGNTIEIHREFYIPVQVVNPNDYPTFLSFATRVDEKERQALNLAMQQRSRPTTAVGR